MTVAVVTGSSTGIGYAAALRLARDGYHVVAAMRNPDGCDIADVAAGEGLTLEAWTLDVDDDGSVASLFGVLLAEHGAVDVLVNNAGIQSGFIFEETPLEDFRTVMETNFYGALRCMQAVLPSMRERNQGCIVNVTSQAGRVVMPCMAAYAASKFALEAASEAVALEVHQFGIRVALIEPGAIMTAIWGKVAMPPPEGPYASLRKRLTKAALHDVAKASSADEVADCIAEAITTDQPKLRWLVGFGAERNVTRRAGWTDEEYIALWNHPDRDEFMRVLLAE